jgi:hypothetical protein
MVRRIPGAMVAASFAVLALIGCGGKTEAVPSGARVRSLGGFGADEHASRVYFERTNAIAVDGEKTIATFDLNAGARVEIEIASRDASPLRCEIHRVRRDGTTELLSPIHSASGFHLETFDATSDDTFVVFFPATDLGKREPQTVIVHLACASAASRCAPAQQPGEACDAVFTCDEGLDCNTGTGHVNGYLEQGRCGIAPR